MIKNAKGNPDGSRWFYQFEGTEHFYSYQLVLLIDDSGMAIISNDIK